MEESRPSNNSEFSSRLIVSALDAFQDKWENILKLCTESIQNREPVESIFHEDELDTVRERLNSLQERVTAAHNRDEVEHAIAEFQVLISWVQDFIEKRVNAIVGYYGGTLPDSTRSQLKLLDASKADLATAEQYVDGAENKPE